MRGRVESNPKTSLRKKTSLAMFGKMKRKKKMGGGEPTREPFIRCAGVAEEAPHMGKKRGINAQFVDEGREREPPGQKRKDWQWSRPGSNSRIGWG